LFDCKAISEKPAGVGFGAAAVALTPQLLMKPATRDGKPVVATIKMPIKFRGPDTPLPDVETQTLLGNQVWLAAPSYAEAVAAFPAKARATATPGHVALNCNVAGGGALKNCQVISEEPKGLGFARAALSLATRFKAPLRVEDGRSTKGMAVHLPVTFPIEMLGGAPRVGKPGFVTLPQPEDIPRDLPRTPEPVTVRVIIDCMVAAAGRLEDCKVASQTPAGFDLSAASLAMAPKFGLTLWTPEGLPTIGARVRIPLRFDLK
jgi:hypothetical protein